MKKYILGVIIFILGITNVYALDVSVEDITINSNSDTITLGDYSITGNTINPDIIFNKLNDYVTYDIKFKNNSKYTIESVTDDNNNEYVKTSYKYDKDLSKPISVTLTYIKETKELELNNINITIKLLSNKGKEEVLEVKIDKSNDIIKDGPVTGIVSSVTLCLTSILLIGYLCLTYNKKNINTMVLMLGLLLIPVSIVFADSEKTSLIIETDNISVKKGLAYVSEPQVEGEITPGDELAIDTEHFYVVSSDEEKTVLLSKYNLYVGDIFSVDNNWNYTLKETISNTDSRYGLQDEDAIGYYENSEGNPGGDFVGTVAFSGTNYWDNSVCGYTGTNWSCTGDYGLLSEYSGSYSGNPYPNGYNKNLSNVAPEINYDEGYGYAQNNGYTIAYYVEEYVNRLKTMGLTNIEGRLLLQEEATSLGCDASLWSCTNAQDWVYSTTYWLGSAGDRRYVWYVASYGRFDYDYFGYDDFVGVRPVIVVSTSLI